MTEMVSKSPLAYRTIGEVADEIGVPQHVLRFWETRFAALKPMKRGGNRRYYRPGDVALLKQINRLLYTDGYTIKGVQKLLAEATSAAEPAPIDAGPTAVGSALTAVMVTVPIAELRAIRNRLAAGLAAARFNAPEVSARAQS